MKSRNTGVKKRSIRIAGHQTSVTLETPFWNLLQNIAQEKSLSLNALITQIDNDRDEEINNLSSATRLYILDYLQDKLAQQSI